jgi:hypothetical protein
MDYPAGTVLGIIRIELCFDLPMATVSPASSKIRDSLGNWYGNSIVILATSLLSKKILNQHVKIILCIPLYRPNAHVITVETEQT